MSADPPLNAAHCLHKLMCGSLENRGSLLAFLLPDVHDASQLQIHFFSLISALEAGKLMVDLTVMADQSAAASSLDDAADSTHPPAKRQRVRVTKSCLPCHRAKRACNRARPVCGRCERTSMSKECHYDPRLDAQRAKRGKRDLSDSDDSPSSSDEREIER